MEKEEYWNSVYRKDHKFFSSTETESDQLPWNLHDADPYLVATINNSYENGKTQNETALEIGCGYGHDTFFLQESGFDVIGVDISELAIEEAKRLYPDCNFKVCDIYKDFPKGNYNLIFDRGCLHNNQDNMEEYFKLVSENINDFGSLIIMAGNYNDPTPPQTVPTPISLSSIEEASMKYMRIIMVQEITFQQNAEFGDALGWSIILKKK